MAEYTDADVPMRCGECNLLEEGIGPMVAHVLAVHPQYTPEEAQATVQLWAEDTYEEIDAYNMWRAEEFRRTGYDPEDADRDD